MCGDEVAVAWMIPCCTTIVLYSTSSLSKHLVLELLCGSRGKQLSSVSSLLLYAGLA